MYGIRSTPPCLIWGRVFFYKVSRPDVAVSVASQKYYSVYKRSVEIPVYIARYILQASKLAQTFQDYKGAFPRTLARSFLHRV